MNDLIAKLRAKWGRNRCRRAVKPAAKRPPLRLVLEQLEDRCTPATFTVNSALDNTIKDTVLTLREAVDIINAQNLNVDHVLTPQERAQITGTLGVNDTIRFSSLFNVAQTIDLNSTLTLSKNMTIVGAGKNLLTLDGELGEFRIFTVDDGSAATSRKISISAMELTNANPAGDGGAIFNQENLTLTNLKIDTNFADQGAGVANESNGHLTLKNSTITGNESSSNAGGFYNAGIANVTGCTFTSNTAGNEGGAIFTQNSLTLQSCTFTTNAAPSNGGALYNNGSMSVNGCTFDGNTATALRGGAVFNTGSNVTIQNSTLTGNSAGNNGGAIYINAPTTLRNITATGNRSGNSGGAIAVNATATIQNVILKGNSAANFGGGINNAATLTVQNSTLSGNSAVNGGGIANGAGATLKVLNSTFSGNSTTGVGGGGIINSGTLTVQNSTFSGNTAPINGGAINNQSGGTVTLLNTTVAKNTSGGFGGGLSSLGTMMVFNSTTSGNTGSGGGGIATDSEASVTIVSTIVAENSGGDLNGQIQALFSLIGDTTGWTVASGSGHNLVNINPMLGPLQDNGGPTLTMAPLPGSPVLNKGSNPKNLTTDQRGFPRTTNGLTDIGAVQVAPVVPLSGHRGQRP